MYAILCSIVHAIAMNAFTLIHIVPHSLCNTKNIHDCLQTRFASLLHQIPIKINSKYCFQRSWLKKLQQQITFLGLLGGVFSCGVISDKYEKDYNIFGHCLNLFLDLEDEKP